MILVKRCISPTQITGLGKNLQFVSYESTPSFNGFSCPEKWMKLRPFCSLLQGSLLVWIWGVFPSGSAGRSDGESFIPARRSQSRTETILKPKSQIPNPKPQWSPVQPRGPQLMPPSSPSSCLYLYKRKAENGQKWKGSVQNMGTWGHPFSALTAGVAAATPFSWWTGALL